MTTRTQISAALTFVGITFISLLLLEYSRKRKRLIQSPSTSNRVQNSSRSVLIVYATTTGTSRKFANTLYHHIIRRCDLNVRISDLKDYSEDKLNTEDIVLFICSTYEGGIAPLSARLFFNDLEDRAFDFRVSKDHLSRVKYAVFGLGGALYGKNYCKVAMDIDLQLEKLGGERIEDLTVGDDQTNLEQTFYKWNSNIVKKLEQISPLQSIGAQRESRPSKSFGNKGKTPKPSTGKDNGCCSNNDEKQTESTCCKNDLDSDQEVEEDEEDLINNTFVDDHSTILDLEEIGPAINQMKSNLARDDNVRREMVTQLQRKALTKEGYKIIGTHSAVKLCRWTKNQLRGRGGCYKHSFYGITSYQCMEATPSLACANKCVFCWRHHKNPVGTEWRWKEDDPSMIVEEAVRLHVNMVHQLKGVPGVQPKRLEEAHTVKHCALSLVGEPIMYPRINEMIRELHKRQISSFLVTNAQFPDRIEQLEPVTQLYVSVDAPTKDSLKAIDRPLFKDYWERFIGSLQALKSKPIRTVYRMTLVKSWNMNEVESYVQLIETGTPDFIEIKGVTYCGKSDASSLTMENVPWHQEVCSYAEEICKQIKQRNVCGVSYSIATEHEHSCCILIAREDKFKVGEDWYTWIDYPKFQELVKSFYDSNGQNVFGSVDYRAKTPSWAVYQSKERGFDPKEQRWRR
eukprot:CAMPEP_0173144400 /NCGR_PEP_ID=MMETSP1105-20130129/7209_1 /TAXON_ID=2985 /ORGANISM="Ochromonas sp., Strain BG-1" /LENGTH=684 /DNA_ID=CAMNT_0014058071 /DNA_START=35 /DNA_END=2086 /DNA_ORIENTATION=+